MRRRRSREFDVFSMSFLDTICCAFGAIILLFVLSKYGEPKALEQARVDLAGRIAKMQEELAEIRGRTEIVNRELKARKIEVSQDQTRLARLRGDLSSVRGEMQGSRQEAEVTNAIEGQLVAAQQSLTDEMKRLLGSQYKRLQDAAIGGVPIDSEYVIFLIDTSGSMYNFHWPLLLQKVNEVLDIYPKLKGFQVMNDQGVYMYPSFAVNGSGPRRSDTMSSTACAAGRHFQPPVQPKGSSKRFGPTETRITKSAFLSLATNSTAIPSIRW